MVFSVVCRETAIFVFNISEDVFSSSVVFLLIATVCIRVLVDVNGIIMGSLFFGGSVCLFEGDSSSSAYNVVSESAES